MGTCLVGGLGSDPAKEFIGCGAGLGRGPDINFHLGHRPGRNGIRCRFNGQGLQDDLGLENSIDLIGRNSVRSVIDGIGGNGGGQEWNLDGVVG